MNYSYDSHLKFDLPYRYELTRTRTDDGDTAVTILCDASFNDSGEKVGDVNVRIGQRDGGIREDARNLRANFPAAYLGTISEMQLGIGVNSSSGYASNRQLVIQILMLVVAIEYNDSMYLLLGLKTGRESDETENIDKLTRHMNRVLESLTIDGKPGRFARLSTSDVRRVLKENSAQNEKDPTASIRRTTTRSAPSAKTTTTTAKPTVSAPSKRTKPIRSQEELAKILEDQRRAKRDAEYRFRKELERWERAQQIEIEQATRKNAEDLAAVRSLEERYRAQQEALSDWEQRAKRLSARRSERAKMLFSQAMERSISTQMRDYVAVARRERPAAEERRQEIAALEEKLSKLGAFAGGEKKATRAALEQARAALAESERALAQAEARLRDAEDSVRGKLEARREEFARTAEQEILPEPRPEVPAPRKAISPAALEVALANKLELGSYYGLDTMRAMCPEYEIDAETMRETLDRLKQHGCVDVYQTDEAEICQYVGALPKPDVKTSALKRELTQILRSGFQYTPELLQPYFEDVLSARQITNALEELRKSGEVTRVSGAGMQLYGSAHAEGKGIFRPDETPVEPVRLTEIISISPATRSVEQKPKLHLETPALEKEEYQEILLMLMETDILYSGSDLIEELQNAGFSLSIQRVGSLLKELCKEGSVEKVIERRKSFYRKQSV